MGSLILIYGLFSIDEKEDFHSARHTEFDIYRTDMNIIAILDFLREINEIAE